MVKDSIRSKWAAVGAAIAVSLGAGGIGITHATTSTGEKPIYLPISPCRLADTRPAPDTIGPRTAPLGPNETYTLSGWGAAGSCNLPSNTTALALNVTAIGATLPTFLTLFPAGVALPNASHLNPAPGQPPIPNAVNVDLNGVGQFSIYNKQGSVNVIIDVVGVYDDHTHDDRYYQKSETYARTETYSQAQVNSQFAALPKSYFAVVSGGNPATLVRSSPGITLTHAGSGNAYFLNYPRDVITCSWVASLGGSSVLDSILAVTQNLGIAASQGSQGFLQVDPDRIAVSVFNPAGDLVVSGFNLVVTCP